MDQVHCGQNVEPLSQRSKDLSALFSVQGRACQNICCSQSSHQHTAVVLFLTCAGDRRQQLIAPIQMNSTVTFFSIEILKNQKNFKCFILRRIIHIFLVYFVERQHEKPEISALTDDLKHLLSSTCFFALHLIQKVQCCCSSPISFFPIKHSNSEQYKLF